MRETGPRAQLSRFLVSSSVLLTSLNALSSPVRTVSATVPAVAAASSNCRRASDHRDRSWSIRVVTLSLVSIAPR